ncbi:cation-transporting ATPase 13A2 isoform X2 [Takifugu flavidus]|uniref:cation-transporting ATPase 13A2 isoform X2 n=2 Tax=Takifugu flavidus TaxID=433684 RepID=UPI002544915D|nr:cation-transporting ATPase 13A2 isoform X2 [Takifugu flavidus]
MDRRQGTGNVADPQSGLPSPCLRDPLLNTASHMDVQGYKWVRWRVWLCHLAAGLSLGLILIVFHWRPRLAVLARCVSCPLALADVLLITDRFGQKHVVEVLKEELEEGSLGLLEEFEDYEWRDTIQLYREEKTLLRYYLFEGIRYVWLSKRGTFCRVSVLSEDWTCKDLYGFQKGLSHLEQKFRKCIYGPNLIDVPVKSCASLLFEEVLNPFYIFQLCSITLWIIDDYYIYAACILVISVLSICISLYQIRKQSITLHKMAHYVTNVTVLRQSREEHVSSVELVPGDCLIIPQEGLVLPCDVALLAGECLVNESMLTGESIPVLKTPLPAGEETYSAESERRHTLYCGTHLIQAKGGGPGGHGAIAVVTNTGFFTAKGSLVSSIMYPQPINFRFYQDAAKFLLILGGLAFLGTIYSFVALYRSRATLKELIIRSLDVVTIVVPPALPAAITTGTIYAQNRLKNKGIFCISPPRINVSGKLSIFCFDKTGTLTEEGLDVWGVMEGGPAGFSEMVPDPKLLPHGHMLSGLACCHTVTLFKDQPLGDPLELKMIESTGWTLEEPKYDINELDAEFGGNRVLAVMRPPVQGQGAEGTSGKAVAIVQRFPFSSALQRMSVVTTTPQGCSAFAYIKGSPEMVASLCQEDTVPPQFSSQLQMFSSEGLRVLALAYKPLDRTDNLKTIERRELEKDMLFLGLLMMKNMVKPQSKEVINILREAQLRCIMVTGDNILTAVNVAKTCGMVACHERVIFVNATAHTASSAPTLTFNLEDGGHGNFQSSADVITQGLYQSGFSYHMAISGKSFAALCDHFPEYLPKVLLRTTVFARMTPDQKTHLVKELQKLNYRVGMCGDGANDCGALRAADVGVSLSEAEASVASPFTSKSENISCVPMLISEGRCSLITSFSLFRYMALYSLCQFSSVLILYTLKTNLGDLQFLFVDICLMTSLALLMGRGGPSQELHACRPPASLLSLPVLGSIFLHTCMIVAGQLAALSTTMSQEWYIPLNSTTKIGQENLPNMENSSVFVLSGFQFIIMAVVVTKGYPHKKPLYYNWMFLCLVLLLFVVMTWLVIYPGEFLTETLKLYNFPDVQFKFLLVALAALNFFLCFVIEAMIDLGMLNCLRLRRRPSKKRYKLLNDSLLNSPLWPPLSRPLSSSHSVIHVS